MYACLLDRSLRWIGLADRSAGIADDLVLGLSNAVVGHQFKRSEQPEAVGVTALLLGVNGQVAQLAASFIALRDLYPGLAIQIRYLTNDYPTTKDVLVKDWQESSTANFLHEVAGHRRRTLADWRATAWAPLIDELASRSGLDEIGFEAFWASFDLVVGPAAAPAFASDEDPRKLEQIEGLARFLSTMVADNPGKDRWSRGELLDAVGWSDRFSLRFLHDFPVGSYVQRNEISEASLAKAIRTHGKGYVSLLGPPGTGKSTLLQREVREHATQHVIRYLAFVPGAAQGQGRGEADDFYEDLNAQLAATGLNLLRIVDDSTRARQQQFEYLLQLASDRYATDGRRVVIVVDGLDHISREEHPRHSLLAALPLPDAIPDGIVFVLGSQTLDFADMPAAVRQQAGADGRRVEIAPLNAGAVERIADALGLDANIDRQMLYGVTSGHPLVTRYLVERLLTADEAERAQLLEGELGFDGDLESIYDAAWRSIEKASDADATKRVLALIAHAEGAIAPECLAEAVSDEAVEAALRGAGHLLDRSERGWTVFHNSFRLFAQGKPILRFGKPDPAFSRTSLYAVLAELAERSPLIAPQRWLRFRYLFLAGASDEALALASRGYFIGQYIAGRAAKAINGDIVDAISLLRQSFDSAKLFDLMLADGELDRRASIMEGATSLVDAYLAVGDIDRASDQLKERLDEGKQWEVVEALLRSGRTERARTVFETYSPFRGIAREGVRFSDLSRTTFRDWARFAILFLDAEQIDQIIDEGLASVEPGRTESSEDRDLALEMVRSQIARALVEADANTDIDAVAARWSLSGQHRAMMRIEAAESLFDAGDFARAITLLNEAATIDEIGELHSSWFLSAARIALRADAADVAKTFLAHAPLAGLGSVNRVERLEEIAPACRGLLSNVAHRVAAGEVVPVLTLPDERLLRGAQHHLVTIGTAIGSLRAGGKLSGAELDSISAAALNFLATARTTPGDDWFLSHLIPRIGDVLLQSLFNLAIVANDGADRIALQYDALISTPRTLFRWWPSFRRIAAVRAYELGGDSDTAGARLEAGLAELEITDPREEVEERAQYAIAFAETGWPERASDIIAELRANSFGVFVPAKKDGIYELWSDLLTHANRSEPGRRSERAATALRFLNGLSRTEGDDSGWRVARNFLYEASAASPSDAWAVAHWAAEKGSTSIDGIFDTALRGAVERGVLPRDAALIAWTHLALPWYSEPHGSTTASSKFIRDLIAAAEPAELEAIEAALVRSIEMDAPPGQRLSRLRTLEDALATRSEPSLRAASAATRWTVEPDQEKTDPEQRSYRHLIDLDGIAKALTAEMTYEREDTPRPKDSVRARYITYGLRSAAVRVIKASRWEDVRAFAAAQPQFLDESDVGIAAAGSALAAGCEETARTLVAPFLSDKVEGWGWPSGSGRLQYHEIRHMLGEADRFERARHEFFDELKSARYGISPLLWSVDRIFPLLFEAPDWPALWERLAEQLATMREFRLGEGIELGGNTLDEEDLVAELFCWALTLGVPILYDQAVRGFRAFVHASHHGIARKICEKLFARGTDATLTAITLLVGSAEEPSLADHFLPELRDLVQSDDAGVAGAASFLSLQWGEVLPIEQRELPAFYAIHLPGGDGVRGEAAIDEHTRGMVIEEPMGWTEGWMNLVRSIASDGDISVQHVRWRAQQLIQTWGGIDAFGHSASKAKESELNRIDFKVSYRRPQAMAILRALRQIVGELWRADRLAPRDFRSLLHRLHAEPDRPGLPVPQAQPAGTQLPIVPGMLWGKDQEAWLDSVTADAATRSAPGILAEWQSSLVKETRITTICESWRGVGEHSADAEDLDHLIDELPRVIHISGLIPLYDVDECHSSRTAIFDTYLMLEAPSRLLIFCPRTAAQLGWSLRGDSIHIFEDGNGREMARTIWWRSGLPQPINEDSAHAEGQQVALSEAGRAAFEAALNPLEARNFSWRHVRAKEGDGTSGTRFATN
ncbi:MAG: ATP-binding protein [Sphingopyxis sp.]|nr:ATP-binding protein [Sphingopyxis sp.]